MTAGQSEGTMEKKINITMGAVMLMLCLSACNTAPTPAPVTGVTVTPITTTATPASVVTPAPAVTTQPSTDVLYLNITWHQHQPLYYKDDSGAYTRPWVRVHSTKDYYDMAATVAKYPKVHLTINLTPVLLKQLNDFVQNGAKDR